MDARERELGKRGALMRKDCKNGVRGCAELDKRDARMR